MIRWITPWPPAWPWICNNKMRHTLLPLPERIILRREYRVRSLIVFSFTVSLAAFIGIAALFPAFIKASETVQAAEDQASATTKSTDGANLKDFQTNMLRSLALLEVLSSDNGPRLSDIVNGIVALRGDLKFDSITVNLVSSTTAGVSLDGVAPTRDSLLRFKSDFESGPSGNKVDLPVSELAKSSNIRFSIQLTEKIK